MKVALAAIGVTVVLLTGCVATAPVRPPVSTQFTYEPPSQVAATKSNMSIAVINPISQGDSLFTSRSTTLRPLVGKLLDSARADLEKVIVSKGFTSSGSFPTTDEMTYSQKERSSLLMRPNFSITVQTRKDGGKAVATVSGTISIEMLEPLSMEKVWIKRFELPETSREVEVLTVRVSDGAPASVLEILASKNQGEFRNEISIDSYTEILNGFYATAFSKIWAMLDANEIKALKSDADKVKGKTGYRAK